MDFICLYVRVLLFIAVRSMKYRVVIGLFIVTVLATVLLTKLIDEYFDPCSHYQPDASLVEEVDKILHKDPKLSSLLNNNSYTINILDVITYPYTEKGETRCLITDAKVEIDFNKPIHVVSHGLITQDFWTYNLVVDVVFDYNNTLEVTGQEIRIHV